MNLSGVTRVCGMRQKPKSPTSRLGCAAECKRVQRGEPKERVRPTFRFLGRSCDLKSTGRVLLSRTNNTVSDELDVLVLAIWRALVPADGLGHELLNQRRDGLLLDAANFAHLGEEVLDGAGRAAAVGQDRRTVARATLHVREVVTGFQKQAEVSTLGRTDAVDHVHSRFVVRA